MAMNFSSAEQGSILVNFSGTYSGETVTVKDSSGNVVLTYKPNKSFGSVLVSSSAIQKGETYSVCVGDKYQQVELTDYIYGSGSGMGGPGMGGGNMRGGFNGQG